MHSSNREILEAELDLGYDAGFCNPYEPEGGREIPLRRKTVNVKPHSWATEEPDTVNFMSASYFKGFYDLKNTVFVVHGMPLYCLHYEMLKGKNALTAAWTMLRECDYGVAWSEAEAEYWRILGHEVEAVERGVDLEFWTPEDATVNKSRFRPSVLFLELNRMVKLPFTFMFALAEASKRDSLRYIYANLGCLERKHQLLWYGLMVTLNLELRIRDFIVGLHPEPWKYYRGADMIVSAVQGGLMSRVGVEALACGCPAIILEGVREKVATLKCRDTPLSMADAMETLWSMTEADPEGVRIKARALAVKHYDVKETARRFMAIGEKMV